MYFPVIGGFWTKVIRQASEITLVIHVIFLHLAYGDNQPEIHYTARLAMAMYLDL